MRSHYLIFSLLAILCIAQVSRADDEESGDWWDRFVGAVSDKIKDGAEFLKKEAGPTIREKFNQAKAYLQDPETHQKIQTFVKEKYESAKEFIDTEVAPEVKKIYNAAVEGAQRNEAASRSSRIEVSDRVRNDDD